MLCVLTSIFRHIAVYRIRFGVVLCTDAEIVIIRLESEVSVLEFAPPSSNKLRMAWIHFVQRTLDKWQHVCSEQFVTDSCHNKKAI